MVNQSDYRRWADRHENKELLCLDAGGVGPGSNQLGTAEMYRPKRFSSAASETKASQFLSSIVNKESKNVQLNLGKGEEVEGVKGEEETQTHRKIYWAKGQYVCRQEWTGRAPRVKKETFSFTNHCWS